MEVVTFERLLIMMGQRYDADHYVMARKIWDRVLELLAEQGRAIAWRNDYRCIPMDLIEHALAEDAVERLSDGD